MFINIASQDDHYHNHPLWCPTGWPLRSVDPFAPLRSLEEFNDEIHRDNYQKMSKIHRRAYAAAATMFESVAEALNALDGKVKLEVLCGGVLEELQKMQLGADRTRPADFPRKFTRMWLSNVP